MSKIWCLSCHDTGIFFAYNTDSKNREVQRCDKCKKYHSDLEAWLHSCPVKLPKNIFESIQSLIIAERL